MSEQHAPQIGSIAWTDLTVENAEEVSNFYKDVVGWSPEPVRMGDYNDFNMNRPGDGEATVGICHARGANANIPPQWLIYLTVENVEKSSKRCVELGGKIIDGPRSMGKDQFCVIQDPAGAVAALIGG